MSRPRRPSQHHARGARRQAADPLADVGPRQFALAFKNGEQLRAAGHVYTIVVA